MNARSHLVVRECRKSYVTISAASDDVRVARMVDSLKTASSELLLYSDSQSGKIMQGNKIEFALSMK